MSCHHNPTDDQIKYKDINTQQLLELLMCQLYQDITNYCSRDIVRVEKHPTDEICHVGRVRPWHAQSYESGCVSPSILTQNTIAMYIFNGSSNHRPAHLPGFTTAQLMLAVGAAIAYHLCLRASKYASGRKSPIRNLTNLIRNQWISSSSKTTFSYLVQIFFLPIGTIWN